MTIRAGDIVRAKAIRSPAMLVIKLDLQHDDTVFAELLWWDTNMNARQLRLDTSMLEHVPMQDEQ